MRWDSPFVLALASTIAIHVIIAIAADAVVLTMPKRKHEIAPVIKFVKIDPPKKKTPPPEKKLEPPPEAAKPAPPQQPQPKQRAVRERQPTRPPDPTLPPPPPNAPPETSGGSEGLRMPDLDQTATGVPVKPGQRSQGTGSGGTGTGTGGGNGAGNGDAVKPTSVATIKTAAHPKGDYDYVSIGKEYPAEARELGIQGDIRVKLIVDENGKVTAATLLNRLGHGLDELALDRARTIAFDAARDTTDRAVASVVVWTFHMTLPKT